MFFHCLSSYKVWTKLKGIDKMRDAKSTRCQKCGKPIGFVTVLGSGLTRLQQPIQNVKIVAICMDSYQKANK